MVIESVDSVAPAALELAMIDKIVALGGVSFLDRLVTLFLGQLDGRSSAIEAASRGEEVEAGIRAAHSLKSSAAQLGLVRLSRIAAVIEKAGRAGRLSEIAGLMPEFDAAAAESGVVIAIELDRRKESDHA